MEDPEAVAVATVLALLTVGRLGPGMADGGWEKEEEEDGLPPDRGAAIAARGEVAPIRFLSSAKDGEISERGIN
jgi:hypothetical protein